MSLSKPHPDSPKATLWLDKHYHTLNHEMKRHFGQKVIKLSIDGGFTCPNRDGSVGSEGCLFCSDAGSGDFAGSMNNRVATIADQIAAQKQLLAEKWPNASYIAYFQSFTNTYDEVAVLDARYSEALSCEGIVGIAIATRPDALSPPIMDYLEALSRKTFLWVELGLQTTSDEKALFLNRGYPLSTFELAYHELQRRNIRTVIHLIAGLPDIKNTESPTDNDFVSSMAYMNQLKPWGIKIHLLHVLKHTALHRYYEKQPFPLPECDAYLQLLVYTLERLSPDIVIHRVTGDAPKHLLVAPWWSLNKRAVLNGLEKCFREQNSWQGKYFTSPD